MKAWEVSYSFRMTDGKVMNYKEIVKAHSIMEALDLASYYISTKVDSDPQVVEHAIWDIGIMQPGEKNESKSNVCDILEIASEFCEKFCKYSEEFNYRNRGWCIHYNDCPINRL